MLCGLECIVMRTALEHGLIRSTLTDRWQTTIPAAVRKALGLRPRQRLTYELREDSVFIRPEREVLDSLYGCLAGSVPAAGKETERDAARAAVSARHAGFGTTTRTAHPPGSPAGELAAAAPRRQRRDPPAPCGSS